MIRLEEGGGSEERRDQGEEGYNSWMDMILGHCGQVLGLMEVYFALNCSIAWS
jgi:hypothetical protein